MPNYNNTIIYKIVCKDVNITKSYGGHTTHIIKRRAKHKSDCNNINSKNYNCYVYQFIIDNGGWSNWDMIWCYDYPCETKKEATLEERKFIEKEKCELNSYKPITTKEEKKEYKKLYRETNKDKKAEYDKEYKENNKYKILKKAKLYRETNKDKKAEYYKNNKEKINQKITCDCGCEINKMNLSRHLKSKKHQNLSNN